MATNGPLPVAIWARLSRQKGDFSEVAAGGKRQPSGAFGCLGLFGLGLGMRCVALSPLRRYFARVFWSPRLKCQRQVLCTSLPGCWVIRLGNRVTYDLPSKRRAEFSQRARLSMPKDDEVVRLKRYNKVFGIPPDRYLRLGRLGI